MRRVTVERVRRLTPVPVLTVREVPRPPAKKGAVYLIGSIGAGMVIGGVIGSILLFARAC